jgi:uncharacterized coiled-coil DUF342 family protein
MNAVASKKDLRQDQAKRESERDQLVARFQQLKQDRAGLLARIGEHRPLVTSLEEEIALIPGQLVDSEAPEAKAKLMDRLAELEHTHKMLSLELAELKRREASTYAEMVKTQLDAGPGPGFAF